MGEKTTRINITVKYKYDFNSYIVDALNKLVKQGFNDFSGVSVYYKRITYEDPKESVEAYEITLNGDVKCTYDDELQDRIANLYKMINQANEDRIRTKNELNRAKKDRDLKYGLPISFWGIGLVLLWLIFYYGFPTLLYNTVFWSVFGVIISYVLIGGLWINIALCIFLNIRKLLKWIKSKNHGKEMQENVSRLEKEEASYYKRISDLNKQIPASHRGKLFHYKKDEIYNEYSSLVIDPTNKNYR